MKHSLDCQCFTNSRDATRHHWPVLEKIGKRRLSERKKILNNADDCFINYICECCQGVLCEAIKIPEKNHPKLKRYTHDLIELADANKSIEEKRKYLVNQGGGFLSFILPALASGLFTLAENLFSKK